MKKFAFIVPAYNAADYLAECLDSILSQDYTDFEVYLVDDCSDDNTLEIMCHYQSKYDNIKVFSLPENMGVSYARNYALNDICLRSDISNVLFIDSDDIVEPNLLSQLSTYVNCYDYIVFGIDRFDKRGSKVLKKDSYSIEMDRQNIIEQLFGIGGWKGKGIRNWGVSNKVLSVRLILEQRFLESLNLGEDLVFLLNVIDNVDKGLFISNCLYHYRQRKSSITHSEIGNYEELVKKTFELSQDRSRDVRARDLAFLGYLFLLVSLYPRICFKCSKDRAKNFRDKYIRKLGNRYDLDFQFSFIFPFWYKIILQLYSFIPIALLSTLYFVRHYLKKVKYNCFR